MTIFFLLFLLLLGLKLAGAIAWSWWFVLVPLWGELLFDSLILAALRVASANDNTEVF